MGGRSLRNRAIALERRRKAQNRRSEQDLPDVKEVRSIFACARIQRELRGHPSPVDGVSPVACQP